MQVHRQLASATLLVLLAAAAALLSRDTAQADPETTSTGYTYDVRIVRVQTPMPEGVEAPCPILVPGETTTTKPWPALLAMLKKRGSTLVLMDQHVTGAPGVVAKMSEERQMPVVALQTRTKTSENESAQRYRSGSKVTLLNGQMISGTGWMTYHVETRGALRKVSKLAEGPTETLHSWEGSHESFRGKTLVLSHRQQIQDPGESSARGIELYCFLTVR